MHGWRSWRASVKRASVGPAFYLTPWGAVQAFEGLEGEEDEQGVISIEVEDGEPFTLTRVNF
jgi:hypothetical protein